MSDAPLDTAKPLSTQERTRLLQGKGTSSVATIRHIFSEEVYRGSGIEDDLLTFAIRTAFEGDRKVQTVRMVATPLVPTVQKALARLHFSAGEKDGSIGLFGWEYRWYTLERSRWEADQTQKK